MQGNRLVLPFGTQPHLRGDARDEVAYSEAASSSSSSVHPNAILNRILDPPPSSSREVVKHDDELAKVTNQAYNELARLSQVAVIAAVAESSRTSTRQQQTRASRKAPPSMFIKAKPKKASKETDLEALLYRNRNLLKSREVSRLLSSNQLDKLKRETIELERAIQEREEAAHAQQFEDNMMQLQVEDRVDSHSSAFRAGQHSSSIQSTRGKAKLISAEDNAKLQRANYEAEQEMQRTRQLEMLSRQMGKIDIVTEGNRHPKRITNEPEENYDVLGLGRGLQDINESDMGVRDNNDDW